MIEIKCKTSDAVLLTVEGTNLNGANLNDADLEGANLKDANLKDANLEKISVNSNTKGLPNVFSSVPADKG